MHDQPSRSSTSSIPSSDSHRHRSDYKSSAKHSYKSRDPIADNPKKSSVIDEHPSSNKRSASTSNENRKKFSTSDVRKPTSDERGVRTHETDSTTRKSLEINNDQRRNPSKYRPSHTNTPRSGMQQRPMN